MDYSKSREVCQQILADHPNDKRAQWEAIKKIESPERRAHVTELLKLHHQGAALGHPRY